MNRINVFEPQTGVESLQYLVNVFNSKWLWPGVQTERFIELFAKLQEVPADSLLPVSSCTDALFIACDLLEDTDIRDEVIIPSIHFVGAANAVIAKGCKPIFCDVDKRSLNPHVEDIERVITKRTVAVILLHYGGRPCDDITQIAELCKDKNLTLIEDSANSMVSKKYGVACGTFGDIGMWSFDPMKLISCGDGGMMYIKNPRTMRIARKMCHFGLTNKSGLSSKTEDRWWEFDVECAGRYSALTDVDSAILLTQLMNLKDFMLSRITANVYYRDSLRDVGDITLPPTIGESDAHSYYFFWIQTDRRDDLAKFLRANDIYTTFRYYPLHHIPLYRQTGKNLPNTEKAQKNTLLLPMHAGLSLDDLSRVCEKVKEFYR
jgi:aminotransferase